MSTAQFESATIRFEVESRHFFTRNYLIGTATVQLAMVRLRDNHLYSKKWIQILGGNAAECTGNLKVTVFAYSGEDSPPKPDTSLGDKDEMKLMLEDLRAAVIRAVLMSRGG